MTAVAAFTYEGMVLPPPAVEVTADRLCAHCARPMADGGAPFPGGQGRACASCWTLLVRVADEPIRHADICHHGVELMDPCTACEVEIESQVEEVIDG